MTSPLPQSIFEAVNKAYEFLCSKGSRQTQGPDPVRIVLLLKTQSILFQRYAEGRPITTSTITLTPSHPH